MEISASCAPSCGFVGIASVGKAAFFSGRFRVVLFQRETDGGTGLIQAPNPLVMLPQLKRSSTVSGQGHQREAFFHMCWIHYVTATVIPTTVQPYCVPGSECFIQDENSSCPHPHQVRGISIPTERQGEARRLPEAGAPPGQAQSRARVQVIWLQRSACTHLSASQIWSRGWGDSHGGVRVEGGHPFLF